MQIGKGKQGVLVGEYGFSRPQDKKIDTEEGWGSLGWIEPACDNPQWVLWFDAKGDATLYTEREKTGAVVGEPIRVFARTPLETKQQKEIKRLKDEVAQLDVQLAGCGVAALGGIKDVAKKGDYGWSPAYQDILDLRKKFESLKST